MNSSKPWPNSRQQCRLALLGASEDVLRDALEQRLAASECFEVVTGTDEVALDRVLRAGIEALLCPLNGPASAARAVERACELGSEAAVLAYGEPSDTAPILEALRRGVVDVLDRNAVAIAAERTLNAIALVRSRAATRAALRELQRYRSFFETGPVIIFRWRAQAGWPVDYVSPNVEQLFGVSAEDFLSGRAAYAASVHPDDLERVAHEVASYSERGAPSFDQEYRVVRPGGEVRWLYDHTVVTRGEDGAITHYEGYVFDITQLERERRTRAQAEQKLYAAQKLESLGLLAGGVAHDFNNLLTTVMGEGAMALAALDPQSPEHRSITNVLSAARAAAGLTRQMLTYAGRASSSPRPCDVRALIGEVSRLMESSLPKNVRLELRLGERPADVSADPAQLQQVFMNLVLNSAEACAERGGAVSLSLGRARARLSGEERDCIELKVADDGAGMDAATLARVFEPFFSTKFHGRGLGLSAVQGIVHAHGGEIEISSEAGVGTTARVLLPTSSSRSLPNAPLPAPALARGERILVVDDEATVARVAARCLQQFGYSTATASGGQEALELIAAAEGAIDAVLLDRTMPRMSGEETLVQLRERFPKLIVVLTSGFDEAESLLASRRASPDAFLRKPFTPDELARTMRGALDASKSATKARAAAGGGASDALS